MEFLTFHVRHIAAIQTVMFPAGLVLAAVPPNLEIEGVPDNALVAGAYYTSVMSQCYRNGQVSCIGGFS